MEKLWAVAEYGKAEDAKQLSRLAENLDCFTFIIGASNYEEVGIYVTENNADYSVNPSVEKFFDYKAFGKYIGDAYYGEFVDGGFISGGAVISPTALWVRSTAILSKASFCWMRKNKKPDVPDGKSTDLLLTEGNPSTPH